MWAEDDFTLPYGVVRLVQAEPEDGKTYVMYHGTAKQAAEKIRASGFRPSPSGMLGRGVYLSRDLQKASRYPLELPENQRVVIRVKVNVGKVKRIDRQDHPLRTTWHENGYDTAWVPPKCGMVKSGLEEDCVWDPKRVTVLEDDFTLPHGVVRLGQSEPQDGKTYIMYHGTTRQAANQILYTGLRQSPDGILGRGVYLSRDLQKASRYPLELPENQRVVIRVKVNVGKVKRIDHQDHPLQTTWHVNGYDTAWVPPNCGMVESGLEEDCVWDPKCITVFDFIQPNVTSCLLYSSIYTTMWAEDDFNLPHGVVRLGQDEPEDGKTYVMYHGTTRQAAGKIRASGFRPSPGGILGRGVYLSRDLGKASRYPLDLPEHQRVVIRVKVNVGKVKRIDCQDHPLRTTWHENGYDTAWVPPNCGMVKSGLEEDCVWDPKCITVLGTIQPPRQQNRHQECSSIYANMWPEDDFTFHHRVMQLGPSDNLLSAYDQHGLLLQPTQNEIILDFLRSHFNWGWRVDNV
ncbi:uncharacterized protein [Salvelinus alpinus]|uniref:uncharacterized protein n=1 Tax=Salvelinus alpinus TaxID=8036 RepID=UPI0039FC628C